MADNVAYKSDASATVATIRTDEDTGGGGHVQYVKQMFGGDGTFTIVSTSNGLPVDIRASNATVTVDNGGTFAVQVDGAALTALQLIDDPIATDDTSTHTAATTKVMGIGAVATPTDTVVDANDIGMPAMSLDRRLHVDADLTAATGVTIDTSNVTIGAALPAGTNAIGTLAVNDGIDIGDVTINNASIAVTSASALDVSGATVTVDLGANNDVQGATAEGAAVAGNPFLMAGDDGTNVKHVAVATDGAVHIDDGGNSITVDNGGTFAVQAAQSGTWNVGTVTTVTTCSTVTNLAQLGGAAISMGTGVRDAGTQRVTIATDDVVPASQSGTWNITNVSGTVSLPTGAATAANQSTGNTALQLIDNPVVAHDAAVSGATGSYMIGLNARSSAPTAVANADATYMLGTLLGKPVNYPYALPGSSWNYAAASGGITNTTGVTAKAAAGAGIRNYVTRCQVVNGHASTATDVQIRDGASGTVLWRGWAESAGGGITAVFDPPLRGTANTLIEVACGTTGTATYFNLQGFTAAE